MTYSDAVSTPGAAAPGVLAVGNIEPSPYNYAFAALFLFLGIAGTLMMGRFWRGGYAERLEDAFSPLGKTQSRAARAIVPLVFPFTLVIGLLYLTLIVKGRLDGDLGRAFEFLANVLTVVFALLAMVIFSVILFNRPRLVVPPHLRESHGLLGDAARAALGRRRR